jgi:hypothetical protein
MRAGASKLPETSPMPHSAQIRSLARGLRLEAIGRSPGWRAREDFAMKALASLTALLLTLGLLGGESAWAADDAKATEDSKVKEGAKQVESGATHVGQGVVDTAKGIGKTVVGGAETAGDKIKEAGEAAKPKAKSAWGHVRDGAISFGHSVKTFFTRPFSSSPEHDTDDKGGTGS